LSIALQNAVQSAHVGGCQELTAQNRTPVVTGVYANPDKRSQPLSKFQDGEDRNGTTPEIPQKTANLQTRAAECGAVAPDAANVAEIDPELRLLSEAWPSLSVGLRQAIAVIVRTGLAARSDGTQVGEPMDRDEPS
jgi:hypothetical protein